MNDKLPAPPTKLIHPSNLAIIPFYRTTDHELIGFGNVSGLIIIIIIIIIYFACKTAHAGQSETVVSPIYDSNVPKCWSSHALPSIVLVLKTASACHFGYKTRTRARLVYSTRTLPATPQELAKKAA